MTVDTDPVFTAAVKLPDAKTKRLDIFFWRDLSWLSSFFQKSVFLHFLYSNSTTHTDQTHTHKHRFCMDLIIHFLAPYANLNYHCCVLSLILFQTNSVRTWTDVLTNTRSKHNSSILQRCPHVYSCTRNRHTDILLPSLSVCGHFGRRTDNHSGLKMNPGQVFKT